jgi:hypothetical protein
MEIHVFYFDLLMNLTGHIFFLVETIKYNYEYVYSWKNNIFSFG